jgi:hypothetical protein
MPAFEEWESFYLIVGGAAGALIGLQFVVMTLLADKPSLASPVAAAALLQLFIGIHNSWDAVSYHVLVRMRNAKD